MHMYILHNLHLHTHIRMHTHCYTCGTNSSTPIMMMYTHFLSRALNVFSAYAFHLTLSLETTLQCIIRLVLYIYISCPVGLSLRQIMRRGQVVRYCLESSLVLFFIFWAAGPQSARTMISLCGMFTDIIVQLVTIFMIFSKVNINSALKRERSMNIFTFSWKPYTRASTVHIINKLELRHTIILIINCSGSAKLERQFVLFYILTCWL